MVTAVLAFLGVCSNIMNAGVVGSVLTPPPLDALFPPTPPLVSVSEEVYYGVDIVDLSILYRVLLGVGV